MFQEIILSTTLFYVGTYFREMRLFMEINERNVDPDRKYDGKLDSD